jgi:hypothetical protein
MTIAEMQAIPDGAKPEPDERLLRGIDDLVVDSDSIVEITVENGKNLFLSA